MTRFKKTSLWITICFTFFVALILTLILTTDKLINQKHILDKIQSTVSETINGQVVFQRVHISFFPRPELVVQKCRFSIPETIKGTVVSLSISPKLLPLIRGEFQNSEITLNTPDLEIFLHRKPKSENKHLNLFSLETIEKKVGTILGVVFSQTPGLRIRVNNARLNMIKGKKPVFWLNGGNANINVFKNYIRFGLQSDASLFENISLRGAVYLNNDQLSISLANLKLNDPRLILSGKLDIHRALPSMSRKVNLELTGKDVDVGSIRKSVLNMTGKIPVMSDILEIVKAGEIPFIELTSHGESMEELGKLENISINSRITNGEIFVPKVDLDLTDVAGDVTISKGILNGQKLKARMGSSKCLDGSLELGFEGKDARFHLDLSLEADLSQLPPILNRVVHNEAFIKENSLLDDVKGRATGRLVLGESFASVKVFVDVSQFNLSANYRRLPYPLKINTGQYVLNGNTSSVKHASGSMGNSTFDEISGQMDWNNAPQLKIKSGRAKIELKEVYPWFLSSKIISEKLKDLKNVKGILTLSSLSLNGPFLNPINYQFQITGEVRNLTLDSAVLPGSLAAAKGSFSITSENISIVDFQTRILDASMKISGTAKDYLQELSRIDLTFQGEIGPDGLRWGEDVLNISPFLRLNAPVSISTAHLTWNNQQQIDFSGDLSIIKGPIINTVFSASPEKLIIEKLIIQDQVSKASIKLGQKSRIMDVLFSGNLKKETMDNILENNEILKGQIKGDFYSRVILDQSLNSTVQGELTVKDFIFPKTIKPSFLIKNLFLTAKKDILKVKSANLVLADNAFDLKGNVNFSDSEPNLEMELFADVLNLDQLIQNLNNNSKKSQNQTAEKSWTYPLRGVVKTKINNLVYAGSTWTPFEADILFKDRVADISITDANVCGITTLGDLKITPQEITIDVKPSAQNKELNETERCLLDQSAKMVGDFNLEGNIKAKGTAQTLMQNAKGDLKFYASKGRFHAGRDYRILIKIFDILNVTDIFKGEAPNIETEGFSFNSIRVSGDIQNGKLVLSEMIIDGTSMNIVGRGYIDLVNKQINVTVLVAPLKTIDFFIKRTPLIKDILGGSLVSYPLGIIGHLDNPRVVRRPISDVDSGLLGIIKRTLQLPIKIIQPVPPNEKNN